MSITKRRDYSAALSAPANPVGKGLIYGGGGALAIGTLAALLPFGLLFWAIAIIVLGFVIV